ncbi:MULTISPECIES: YihY/virulence factor BrkB family protein [unclassified Mycoplasma]|uniref:YihY/virulence factor BrkB family protein n=1 Tax=unclassified Mycoplasma TaxID=2683645 RepID=UPI00211C85AC|nr:MULTISPECIES: YihY/virulence factor BrkB family protein [unclassified Mycoplasma]UUM19935.1 YihY/virulence factor BrkB family protein [Mycoplasma sp. 1578d]UUM24916.1 YihY/virulence factor BrkB family protein [Mycoplasma sp. 3686d]
MKSLNTKNPYRKLLSFKYKRRKYITWSINLIWDDPYKYLGLWFDFILKLIISIFAWFLTFPGFRYLKFLTSGQKHSFEAIHEINALHRKRRGVVDIVFVKFISKDFNFTWLTIAFYFLISFIPVIYIIFNLNLLLGFIVYGNTPAQVVFKERFINGTLGSFFPDVPNYVGSIDLFSTLDYSTILTHTLFFVTTLLFASNGYGKLVVAVNYMYDHKKVGSYLGNRAKGFALVLMVSCLLWAFSNLQTFTESIVTGDFNLSQKKSPHLSKIFFVFWTFFFLLALFIALFKFSPSFQIKINHILRGAIFSTIPNLVFVLIFSFWINKTLNYDRYGSIGFVLTLAFFITWFVNLMFFGILFNQAYYKMFHNQKTYNRGYKIFYIY